jgi:hypothetical protein
LCIRLSQSLSRASLLASSIYFNFILNCDCWNVYSMVIQRYILYRGTERRCLFTTCFARPDATWTVKTRYCCIRFKLPFEYLWICSLYLAVAFFTASTAPTEEGRSWKFLKSFDLSKRNTAVHAARI